MFGDRRLVQRRESAADLYWKQKLAECDHGWFSALVVVSVVCILMNFL